VIGDDTAKWLEDRIDGLERLVQEFAVALASSRGEQRQAKAAGASIDAPASPRKGKNGKPPFDRRTYHARYMRAWRKRRSAAKALGQEGAG
jgi:hypothetical protein